MSHNGQFTLPSPKPVTHVIFDFDGLLIDSENYYDLASINVMQKYGKQYTWETKKKILGVTPHLLAKILVDDLDLPLTPEEYLKAVTEEYIKVSNLCQLMPGAEKLLEHLKKHQIPMAIATGSRRSTFDLNTQKFGPEWREYFHHIITTPEEPLVKEHKPAPDAFLVCRDKFDPPLPEHEKCLVFEDAPFGALAGCRAGMQVVMVPDPRLDLDLWFNQEPELRPCQVIRSLEQFRPEDFGLPPFS